MARLLRSNGADDGACSPDRDREARQEADLVLALTRGHRQSSRRPVAPAVRRTFTLREFARLLEQVDPSALPEGTPAERLRAAMPLVVAKRGLERTSAEDDDVVDPFALAMRIHRIVRRDYRCSEDHRRDACPWQG